MTIEIRRFNVTITAGTTKANPQTTDISFPDRIVRRIDWTVPPGVNGQVGFRFASGGIPVLPSNDGTWVVTDDEKASWPVDDQLTTGAWQLQGYNLGTYDHTIYVTMFLDLVNAGGSGGSSFAAPLAVNEVV